jgi:Protein of unknown function (DUF3892)
MAVRITCIRKDNGNHENPYLAIESLGWINESNRQAGESSRLEMYDFIVHQNGQAYVTDSRGDKAYLEGKISSLSNKFVRTIPDGIKADNLLKLPECKY